MKLQCENSFFSLHDLSSQKPTGSGHGGSPLYFGRSLIFLLLACCYQEGKRNLACANPVADKLTREVFPHGIDGSIASVGADRWEDRNQTRQLRLLPRRVYYQMRPRLVAAEESWGLPLLGSYWRRTKTVTRARFFFGGGSSTG